MTERRAAVPAARARFELELEELKRTLDRDWGWAPRGGRWILPLAALAAGFVAASAVRRGARRLLPPD